MVRGEAGDAAGAQARGGSASPAQPLLSVVIPAFNEAPAIRSGKLERVASWLAAQEFASELIVVDDGSRDDTVRCARAAAGTVLSIAHAGKAAALLAGMELAQGRIILLTDMDQATPIAEAPRLLEALERGAEVAIGSRGLARTGAPPGRYLISWGQMLLQKALLGLPFADTQCGFKALTRAAATDIARHVRVYHPSRARPIEGPSVTSGFDVELLLVARRLGYRISEVPVAWHYENSRRVSLMRDAPRGVRDLVKILLARARGRYPRRAGTKPSGPA